MLMITAIILTMRAVVSLFLAAKSCNDGDADETFKKSIGVAINSFMATACYIAT